MFIFLFLLIPSICLCANQIHFENPWTLQRKVGGPVPIVDLTLESDVNGDQIAIYTTASGEEGFVDIGNIENIQDLNSLMREKSEGYPEKEYQTDVGSGTRSSQYEPEPETSSQSDTNNYSSSTNSAISATAVVAILNSMYGNVCTAELNGFFAKTLRLDWTSNTNKLHMMKVLTEVGTVKEGLYADGVRYLQFPNDAGTYNVIDWKTGNIESISERAPYYFTN